MNSVLEKKRPKKTADSPPLILNQTDIAIISMIAKFRYAGSIDVAHFLFSPASITHVRGLLARLSERNFLYKFQLPTASAGNRELIFCLGAKGRSLVARDLGQPVDWWYRPYKQRLLSISNVLHHLILTRTVVAAHSFCRKQADFRLVQMRLCYELEKQPAFVEITSTGKTEKLKVIPDAWVLFQKLINGAHERFIPILLELDRGTEYQRHFRQHVCSRIAFIQSGGYRSLFHTNACVIAYVTTGQTPEYRETRRRAMCAWTNEVLKELGKPSWASIFRICSVVPDELYSTPLFDAIWYRPDSATPVTLFTP